MTEKAILYDATLCTGCRGCQVACKSWNGLSGETTTNRGSYENPPSLSSDTWLKIGFAETDHGGKPGWLFTRQACMHCTGAVCLEVCPTKAVYRNANGFVSYDRDLCSGCGYCTDFCPFRAPQGDRNVLTGNARMDKCTMCTSPGSDRIGDGELPACVKTCPTGALVFGDRDRLVSDGKARVSSLAANGSPDAYLYGEKEMRGLHVLYVLGDRPAAYGLPENPEAPPLVLAWKDIVQPLGWFVGAATLLGLSMNYIVARANVKKEE